MRLKFNNIFQHIFPVRNSLFFFNGAVQTLTVDSLLELGAHLFGCWCRLRIGYYGDCKNLLKKVILEARVDSRI